MATSVDVLPAHLLPLAMEAFPHSLAQACGRRFEREPRSQRMQFCSFSDICEEEEEGGSSLEEDQARRTFLRTLEGLRRSMQWAPLPLHPPPPRRQACL